MSEVSTSDGMEFDDDETSVFIDGNDLNDIFEQQQREDPLLLYKNQKIDSCKSYIQPNYRQRKISSSSQEPQWSQPVQTKTAKRGRGRPSKHQEKAVKNLSKKVATDETDGEIKYSFVPEKRYHVNSGSVKKVSVGPLKLSKRMSWKLAKCTNALESPFFVSRLSFSPTKISQRRPVVVRMPSKPPRRNKRKTFGRKGRKLPTRTLRARTADSSIYDETRRENS